MKLGTFVIMVGLLLGKNIGNLARGGIKKLLIEVGGIIKMTLMKKKNIDIGINIIRGNKISPICRYGVIG